MSRNKIKLINSNVVVENANHMQVPKLPDSSVLEYGEPAINYAKGFETISIKNSNNEIITFSSDAVFINLINALENRIDELENRIAALKNK